MSRYELSTRPIHLGLGATADVQPEFTGDMSWYMGYGQRTGDDGAEGRLVSMHRFDGAWDVWEVHPHGTEVVLCTEGTLELVQQIDGDEVITRLNPGEYAINEPGVWHSANDTGPCAAVFITAGMGTENHPRE
ncbi:MAG: cupin domain-containing protein [Actinomycetota bacterium]